MAVDQRWSRIGLAGLLIASLVVLPGCATTRAKKAQATPERVAELEEQLKQRDEDVRRLEEELASSSYKQTSYASPSSSSSKSGKKMVVNPKIGVSISTVQKALKNAGYYNGSVDGVAGKGTRSAVVSFQKAYGLPTDGIVGPKTWEKLKKFLTS